MSISTLLFFLIPLFVLIGVVIVAALFMRQGVAQDYRQIYDPLVPDYSAQSLDFEGHVQEGNRQFESFCYREALGHYLAAIKLNPKDARVQYQIGRIYQNLEDYYNAELAFQKVIMLTPQSVGAMFELSRICMKQGKFNQALKYADKVLALQPDYEEGIKLKTRILLEKRDFDAAAKMLLDLLQKHPGNSELLLLLATTYLKTEAWDKAMDIYTMLLSGEKEGMDSKNLRHHIYVAYKLQHRYDEAIATLEDILERGSGTIAMDEIRVEMAQTWAQKASLIFQNGQYEEGLFCYDKTIEILRDIVSMGSDTVSIQECKDKLVKYYCYKASGLAQLNNFEEAIACYNEAITFNPIYPEVYAGLGEVYSFLNDTELAIFNYQKCIDLGSTNVQNHMALSVLYENIEDFDNAIITMEKAEHISPTDQVFYALGTLYGLKGDIAKCIQNLKKAIARDPSHIDAYYNLGVAYEQEKQFKDALKMYKKVLELDRTHVEAKANLKHIQKNRLTKW